tara:strand:+ start:13350 stop:15074 length:1725 start_codon:yes stop_codon:yes gene_type:complete
MVRVALLVLIYASFVSSADARVGASDDEKRSEWTFSPSIHLGAGQSKVDSPVPSLNRNNFVMLGQINNQIDYTGTKLNSTLINELKVQRYSEDDEFDWVNSNWLWESEYKMRDDRLQFAHLFIKKIQLFDTVRGSFADDWYAKDNGAVRYRRNYRVNYRLPVSAPIDANIRYTHNDVDLKAPEVFDEGAPQAGGDFEQRRLGVEFGHYQGLQKLKWRVKANRDLSIRQQDNRFLVYEVRGRASYPVYDNWNAVGTGFYSQHENPDGFEYGLENEKIQYRTVGLGLAWQAPLKDKRFQITHEWDQSNDLTFWGGEVEWRFSERWAVTGFMSRRFYGDASGLDIYYDVERNRFSLKYQEAVEIDFFLLPDSELLGIYICDIQEDLDNEFDPERCTLPEGLNTNVGPNQYLSIQRQNTFPVEERLILRRGWAFRWDYLGPRWAHTIYGFDNDQEDLEFDWRQENVEGFFEGDYRFASNYFFKVKFHFRGTDLLPSEQGTRNRFYSLGYHHELNSKADWSISLIHVNQDSTFNQFSYEENRVSLGYTHHFGRTNRHRRDLFQYETNPGAVDYGINSGW